MKTPRLNRRLILEAPQRVPDGSGGYAVNWLALGTHWAEISARGGNETIRSGEPVSEVAYRIVLRGAPVGSPARPLPEQRFRDGARTFNIRAVVEQDTDGRYLTCFATEEMAT